MTGAPDNPFSAHHHTPGVLPYLFGRSADEILEEAFATRASQIVGAEGTGKTTLLKTLARRLSERGHCVFEVRADRADCFAFGGAQVALVDEADALSPWQRFRLRRHCRARGIILVCASHRDLGLPTLAHCAVDHALAIAIVERVLDRSPRVERRVGASEVVPWLQLHRGNLREALFSLYGVYEERWAASARR